MCPFVRNEHTRGSRGIITPDGTAQGPRFRLQFLLLLGGQKSTPQANLALRSAGKLMI